MPTLELGSPAYKKYDIEAWMPGTQFYGEVFIHYKCKHHLIIRINLWYFLTSRFRVLQTVQTFRADGYI